MICQLYLTCFPTFPSLSITKLFACLVAHLPTCPIAHLSSCPPDYSSLTSNSSGTRGLNWRCLTAGGALCRLSAIGGALWRLSATGGTLWRLSATSGALWRLSAALGGALWWCSAAGGDPWRPSRDASLQAVRCSSPLQLRTRQHRTSPRQPVSGPVSLAPRGPV